MVAGGVPRRLRHTSPLAAQCEALAGRKRAIYSGVMPERDLPKPNTQALSWFYGEDKKQTLVLNPKYQRNPIWSLGQKCFLIDSLISSSPIPQVFINIKTAGAGRDRKTSYEVVDGQQRLRAILEFMNDEYPLVRTTVRSYPVSDIYEPHVNKKYSELPANLQEAIWNYPLAVQELRGWSDAEIRALFRRLNYVVERLSKQELRHSQYFGEFVEAVEDLATDPFWDEIELFTRRDSQRMKDVEFISELFVLVIDGVQDGQKSLDKFYADYDVLFPKRYNYVAKFKQIISSLQTLEPFLIDSRYTKKADFYALFGAVSRLNASSKRFVDISAAITGLRRLQSDLEAQPELLSGTAARYYSSVVEGPNKRAKREERMGILESILSHAT
jgi:hypothetical protein